MRGAVASGILPPSYTLDSVLRLIVATLFLFWNAIEGSVFHNEYPASFVTLYPIPIWRFLLLAALVAGATWCPSVGIMFAFTVFFYVMDMEVTMDKWK